MENQKRKIVLLGSALFLFVSLGSIEANAQFTMKNDLKHGTSNALTRAFTDGGRTIRSISGQPDVDGHPYISDIWLKGKVVFANGLVKEVERLNYDALDHMLIQFQDGIEFEFTEPVKSFHLYSADSVMNFLTVNGNYYELLHQGEAILLRKHLKEMQVGSRYASAWGYGNIVSKNQLYYMTEEKGLVKVKQQQDIVNVFKTQKPLLTAYVKSEKLNFKMERDLSKFLNYLKTL